MAQSRPAPAAGPVADPGGPMWPLNGTPSATPTQIGGSPSSPPVSQPVMRQGTSLPLNTPRTQHIGNSGGLSSWPVAGPVADPGASRLTIGQSSTIGYPADRAVPEGGDPGALGSGYSGPDIPGPGRSQTSPNANPNPGAL